MPIFISCVKWQTVFLLIKKYELMFFNQGEPEQLRNGIIGSSK
jgi:hypothetical protein